MVESIHADRRARRAAYFGLTEVSGEVSMSNTKAELLAAAGEAGDKSMTKAELLAVIEGGDNGDDS